MCSFSCCSLCSHLVFTWCSLVLDPEFLSLADLATNCLKTHALTCFALLRARTTPSTTKSATANEMAAIQINLSAPIYGSDGTGFVPNKTNERVEAPDDLLVAIQRAFLRELRKQGPRGDAMRAMFGKQITPLLFPSCVSSTNNRNSRHR